MHLLIFTSCVMEEKSIVAILSVKLHSLKYYLFMYVCAMLQQYCIFTYLCRSIESKILDPHGSLKVQSLFAFWQQFKLVFR